MSRSLIALLVYWFLLQGLHSLTLPECLNLALQKNKELLSAKEDIIMADQTYYEVRGLLLPQITLQGGYQLNTTWLPDSALPGEVDFSESLDEFATTNDSTLAGIATGIVNSLIPNRRQKEGSLAGQIKLDQIVFSGGKLINGLNAVGRYRSLQRLQYELKEQEVIAQTVNMFYQTLLAEKVYSIQTEALRTAQRHLERVELFHKEGQISEFDLLRAELEVAKLRPSLLQARNNHDLALSAFRKQIGAMDTLLALQGEFVLPETHSEDLETAVALASKQRIELRLLAINTEMMGIKYKAEKGNYLPNIALSAGYSMFTAADEYALERSDFGTAFTAGVGFSLPLFTGFTNTAKRINARHGLFQAQIQEEDTRELIGLEVLQAWQTLHNALESYQVQLENIKMAERNLQLAQLRFENQVGIQLEVFDAQMMLSSIKLNFYNAIYEVISANVKFKKAMGFRF